MGSRGPVGGRPILLSLSVSHNLQFRDSDGELMTTLRDLYLKSISIVTNYTVLTIDGDTVRGTIW